MNDTNKCEWSEYLKLLPVIYAFLTIVSFIKMYTYYQFFNINISIYLELTEILTSFLDDLIYYILFIVYIFITFLGATFFKAKNRDILPNHPGLNYLINMLIKLVFYYFIYVFPAALMLFGILMLFLSNMVILGIALTVFGFIQAIISFIVILTTSEVKDFLSFKTIVLASIELLLFVVVFAVIEGSSVKKGKISIYTTIEFKGAEKVSDDNNIFIGKTNKNIFRYNIVEHQTTAFFLKDVGYIK